MAPPGPEDDSTRCVRRTEVFFLPVRRAFEDVVFFFCFLWTTFFEGFVCFLRWVFFARCVPAAVDLVCFFLVFFLLEGMAAVYHRRLTGGLSAAEILGF